MAISSSEAYFIAWIVFYFFVLTGDAAYGVQSWRSRHRARKARLHLITVGLVAAYAVPRQVQLFFALFTGLEGDYEGPFATGVNIVIFLAPRVALHALYLTLLLLWQSALSVVHSRRVATALARYVVAVNAFQTTVSVAACAVAFARPAAIGSRALHASLTAAFLLVHAAILAVMLPFALRLRRLSALFEAADRPATSSAASLSLSRDSVHAVADACCSCLYTRSPRAASAASPSAAAAAAAYGAGGDVDDPYAAPLAVPGRADGRADGRAARLLCCVCSPRPTPPPPLHHRAPVHDVHNPLTKWHHPAASAATNASPAGDGNVRAGPPLVARALALFSTLSLVCAVALVVGGVVLAVDFAAALHGPAAAVAEEASAARAPLLSLRVGLLDAVALTADSAPPVSVLVLFFSVARLRAAAAAAGTRAGSDSGAGTGTGTDAGTDTDGTDIRAGPHSIDTDAPGSDLGWDDGEEDSWVGRTDRGHHRTPRSLLSSGSSHRAGERAQTGTDARGPASAGGACPSASSSAAASSAGIRSAASTSAAPAGNPGPERARAVSAASRQRLAPAAAAPSPVVRARSSTGRWSGSLSADGAVLFWGEARAVPPRAPAGSGPSTERRSVLSGAGATRRSAELRAAAAPFWRWSRASLRRDAASTSSVAAGGHARDAPTPHHASRSASVDSGASTVTTSVTAVELV